VVTTPNATSNTTATVIFTPLDGTGMTNFDFVFGGINYPYTFSAFLNVAGTATATVSFGWTADGAASLGNPLGYFDISARRGGGNANAVTFYLTATGGTTWADAAHVLEPNAAGFDAAAYVEEQYIPYNYPKGYIAEGSPVPVPPSALLLGSGLLGLVGLRFRKGTCC
jgi:hypothetical protein